MCNHSLYIKYGLICNTIICTKCKKRWRADMPYIRSIILGILIAYDKSYLYDLLNYVWQGFAESIILQRVVAGFCGVLLFILCLAIANLIQLIAIKLRNKDLRCWCTN